jgi:5-methylcytosine-specific restriction endonuclease McrA
VSSDKVCIACHIPKPLGAFHNDKNRKDGKTPCCKECVQAYQRTWRKRPEVKQHLSEYFANWHEAHPGKMAEYSRIARARDPEKHRAAYTRWNSRPQAAINKKRYQSSEKGIARRAVINLIRHDIDRDYKRIWHEVHAEAVRARARNWARANPIRRQIQAETRRARILGNGGTYTEQEWQFLCSLFQYRCARCGEKRPLSVDHITPLVRGGRSDIANIQPLCRPCNSRKHTEVVDYRSADIVALITTKPAPKARAVATNTTIPTARKKVNRT